MMKNEHRKFENKNTNAYRGIDKYGHCLSWAYAWTSSNPNCKTVKKDSERVTMFGVQTWNWYVFQVMNVLKIQQRNENIVHRHMVFHGMNNSIRSWIILNNRQWNTTINYPHLNNSFSPKRRISLKTKYVESLEPTKYKIISVANEVPLRLCRAKHMPKMTRTTRLAKLLSPISFSKYQLLGQLHKLHVSGTDQMRPNQQVCLALNLQTRRKIY